MTSLHRFGRVEVHGAERRLVIDGRQAPVGARAFDILLALIERRERTVSKEELLDLVWPGLVVEEANVQVQVSALRKLLGHDSIATIPGIGYRLSLAKNEPASGPEMGAGSPRLHGRKQELADLMALLERERIVSVVGAGGIGKTRIAQAVGHLMRERMPDGMLIIELAGLADPGRVAGAVAQALGAAVHDEALATQAALDALRDQRLLLILDNCEHLLAGVADLVAAVHREAPGATLLVTSQQPLQLAGERVYRLGSLALPGPDASPSVADATEFGAVELFVARAKAVDPSFAMDERSVGVVVELCRRLDGIALALELAAARVPLLGVEGVLLRLDERFKLLTGGTRMGLQRHQTLRAALTWSHGLLSEPERKVFRRLAVFAGGFTLEAAQQAVSDEAMDAWQVLDCIGGLVDKSLVAVDPAEPRRYRLLETMRAFALEQLASAAEADVMAQRHAQAILALFETAYEQRWHGRLMDHLLRYRPELDNLRVALRWSALHDADLDVALAGAGAWLWWQSGLQWEGVVNCERAITRCSTSTPPAFEARLLSELPLVYHVLPRVVDALQHVQRALGLYRRLSDRVGEYLSLAWMAPTVAAAGDGDEARRMLADVALLEDASWPSRLRLQRHAALCAALWFTGPVEALREATETRCRLAFLADNEVDELLGRANLVGIDLLLGRHEAVIANGREIAEQLRRRRLSLPLAYVLGLVSWAFAMSGQHHQAGPLLREAQCLMRHDAMQLTLLDIVALVAVERGRHDGAARLLGAAVQALAAAGYSRHLLGRYRHELLNERLREVVAPDELGRLMGEGRSMTPRDSMALAMRELD